MLALALAGCATASAPEAAPPRPLRVPPPGRTIDVHAEHEVLADVVARMAAEVGAQIEVAPHVRELVSVSLVAIDWRLAVEVIARLARCRVEQRPGGLLLLTQTCSRSFQYSDADVRVLLRLLAAYGGWDRIDLPDSVRGTLDVDLTVAPGGWRAAVEELLGRVGDYRLTEEGLALVVVSAGE